jgi:hypothetical protein
MEASSAFGLAAQRVLDWRQQMATKKQSKKSVAKAKITNGKMEILGKPVEHVGTIDDLIGKARKPKTPKTEKAVKEPTLAVEFRVLSLPPTLWGSLKDKAAENKSSTRVEMRRLLDTELAKLVEELQTLGFNGRDNGKRVRASLDASIIGDLAAASGKVGVASVELLRLVLARGLDK